MSQEAFAEVLGVHRTYMGGLERGERNLTLRSLERIAEQMCVEVEELMRRGERGRCACSQTVDRHPRW